MTIIKRSYLDLSPERRREGAKAVRDRLRAALGDPGLSPEATRMLQAQMLKIDLWEAGALGQNVSGVTPSDLQAAVRRFSQEN